MDKKIDDIIKETNETINVIQKGDNSDTNFLDLLNSENESEFFKAIQKMYYDIATKTEISEKELKLVVRYIYYANRINKYSPEAGKHLLDSLENYYKVSISKERTGRKEFFEALTLGGQRANEDSHRGFFSKFFR